MKGYVIWREGKNDWPHSCWQYCSLNLGCWFIKFYDTRLIGMDGRVKE